MGATHLITQCREVQGFCFPSRCIYGQWVRSRAEATEVLPRVSETTEAELTFVADTLQSLVGQQNARHGVVKVFNALQERKANKHLLYVSNQKRSL